MVRNPIFDGEQVSCGVGNCEVEVVIFADERHLLRMYQDEKSLTEPLDATLDIDDLLLWIADKHPRWMERAQQAARMARGGPAVEAP